MQFKKYQNNNYVLSDKYWVRDFTKNFKPYDLNTITLKSDYKDLIQNEIIVKSLNIPEIGSEKFNFENCLIVSDGYQFNKYKHLLISLPNVCVIGVNRALAKWKDENGLLKRQMNFFLVNNPYSECLSQLPKHRYFPKCVVSNRTYPDFIKQYEGTLYRYSPVGERFFTSGSDGYYQIDDYRNPICAAIGLSYKFKVKKLALFCCDDVFDTERPAAEQIHNGLWMYPQHKVSHSLINGNLYWLRKSGVEIQDFSMGLKYDDIETNNVENIGSFFGSK